MRSFEKLIQEIGEIVNLPLHAQEGRFCTLQINHTMRLHIEDNEATQELLIIYFITEIPAGKFRENILKEAMKANSYFPRVGTFGYLEKNNTLTFYTNIDNTLSADKVSLILEKCVDVGMHWFQAIQNSQIPNLSQENPSFI